MFRSQIIRKYLADQEVYMIIGHDLLVYLRIAGGYLLLTFVVFALYYLIITYVIGHIYVRWIAAIVGLGIYFKGLYELADEYLDALVVTNRGLLFFRRNGLFSYTTNYLQWVAIDSLKEEQNSFRDRIFKKGDITIRLEDELHKFREVSRPALQVSRLLHWKDKILGRFQYHENETDDEVQSKYEILVEALGEVVSEYVEKKKNTEY